MWHLLLVCNRQRFTPCQVKRLEMQYKYSYGMQSWGVNLAQMHTPTVTTTAYVDMLLDVALHQVGDAPYHMLSLPKCG